MVLRHALQAFLIAGVVAPFSYYAGLGAKRLRLPQITGYLVSGIVCGPYVLGILSQESVSDLNIIEGACLGIIGLAAGAELHLSELNRSKQQVVSLTAGICLLTWLLCYFSIRWSAALTPVLHVNSGQLAAIASLGATLMMARSPASAIAVLKEMEAKGPFVALVMGVVVLKDVVVIVTFALVMELVPLIVDHNSSGMGAAHLLLPLLSVGVSLSAGLLGGFLTGLALQHQLHSQLAGLLANARLVGGVPHAVVAQRCKQVIVLLLSTTVFSITRSLEAEPLLACVTAGMLLANRRPSGAPESSQEELAALINGIMVVTNVAFFGLAGASLKLSAIAESVWVALVVFLVRLGAIMAGSWLGCSMGGVKSEQQRRVFWMSMVTQAGVAMGLARIAGTAFTDWGPGFQTVMMAIIMINMLLGPPLFRSALIQVGEARSHGLPSAVGNLHRDASAQPSSLLDAAAVVARHGKAAISSKAARGGHGAAGQEQHLSGGDVAHASPPKLGGKADVHDPGGGHDSGGEGDVHHVVVSSGALLTHLGGGRTSTS